MTKMKDAQKAAPRTLFTEKGSRIARDPRYGVGKRMGRTVYVHRRYMADVVPEKTLRAALLCLPRGFSVRGGEV